jgi:peptide/nickel transport system substrate-binding protein
VFKAKDFDLTIVSHTEPMDIGIYARDDYYFQYGDADFKAIMAELANATDPAKRTELMQAGAEEDRRRLRQRLPVPARSRRRHQR